jgi:hypothetical protein
MIRCAATDFIGSFEEAALPHYSDSLRDSRSTRSNQASAQGLISAFRLPALVPEKFNHRTSLRMRCGRNAPRSITNY